MSDVNALNMVLFFSSSSLLSDGNDSIQFRTGVSSVSFLLTYQQRVQISCR